MSLLILLGCSAEGGLLGSVGDRGGVSDIEVLPAEDQVTALEVSWRTDEATSTRLRVEQGPRSWVSGWTDQGNGHAVRVAGLRADEELSLVVEDASGGISRAVEAWTEPLPTWVPELDAAGLGRSGAVVSVLDEGGDSLLLALDREGAVVGYVAADTPYVTSVEPLPDGGFLAVGDDGLVHLDPELRARTLEALGSHHDLAVRGEDVARLHYGEPADMIDRVVLDSGGETRLLFDLLDHYEELELIAEIDGELVPWSHFNSVQWDPWREAWLVSWGSPSGLMWLDDEGRILDVQDFRGLVGRRIETSGRVLLTHQVTPTPEGVLAVANVVEGEGCSQVLELAFRDGGLEQVGAYDGPCVNIFALGGVASLEGGGWLVSWSTAGVLEQVEEGVAVLDARLPFGLAWGYAAPWEEPFRE